MKKVLVVDDEEMITSVIKRHFEKAEIPVVVANSVAEAMQLVKSDLDIWLILSDVMMPDETQPTGWDFHERLIADGDDCLIQLATNMIFMSGCAPDDILAKIEEADLILFSKPLDFKEVIRHCRVGLTG
jgi:CheY-like chemotaxis protein